MLILAAACLLLVACADTASDDIVRVESVQIEDPHVYLGPADGVNTVQLKPWVMPRNATNDAIGFRLVDINDSAYLRVMSDGTVSVAHFEGSEAKDYYVRCYSVHDPSVYLDVCVTVERVGVKKISFNPSTVVLNINNKEPYVVQPIFEPAHAADGRDLTYESLNPQVAAVDAYGNVTPVGIGKTTIWVSSMYGGEFGNRLEAQLAIDVRYGDLNYKLEMVSDASSMKQIVGRPETIRMTLSQMDEFCDPAPQIRWYVGNLPINEPGVQNNRNLEYTPRTLPVGEDYVIRAVLSNSTQMLELVSMPLKIYNPLDSYNVDVLNEGELRQGDILHLGVSIRDGIYPPESFEWTVDTPSGFETVSSTGFDFYYELKEEGDYIFTSRAIVKGEDSGVTSTAITVSVGESAVGDEIFEVALDGASYEGAYVPVIRWQALGDGILPDIEVRIGSNIVALDKALFPGDDRAYIPATVATFADRFEYRLRGPRYGWTQWFNYDGSIGTSMYPFFDEIAPGMNGYITDMRELGDLFNYILVFRPDALRNPDYADPDGGYADRYDIHLYMPFGYDDLDPALYPVNGSSTSDNPKLINAYNLANAAVNAYCETTRMQLAHSVDADGSIRYGLIFLRPDSFEFKDTTEAARRDLPTLAHYAATPWAGATFPIDSRKQEIEVRTSDQLYLAAVTGFNPVPAKDSPAEAVYAAIRTVLERIVNEEMTDAQRVHAIYDYLTLEVAYDSALTEIDDEDFYQYKGFYIEGVLEGKAVCDGIAKTFALMSAMLDLPVYKVTGEGMGGVGHAWNKVRVADNWFVVDATWGNILVNAFQERQTHAYVLVSDGTIDGTHTTYGEYPAADARVEIFASVRFGESDALIDSVAEFEQTVTAIADLVIAASKPETVYTELKFSDDFLEAYYNDSESLKTRYPDYDAFYTFGIGDAVAELIAGVADSLGQKGVAIEYAARSVAENNQIYTIGMVA